MKKILKIVEILIILVIFLTSIIGTNNVLATDEIASGSCGENMTWSFASDGTLTITGSGNMSGDTCPWIDYKDQVKNVVFNGNITSISDRAFQENTNLETIFLPDSITEIGIRSFAQCTSLKTVKFPKNLVRIGMGAFYQCNSLESIDLPERVMYINEYAFGECTSLKTATIRAMHTTIEDAPETISSTAHIYGYSYSDIFYYARFYGRTFTDLNTNVTTTETITNQSFLDVLTTTNLQALGPTSHGGRSYIYNTLQGYRTDFAYEKDTTNEKYQEIKKTVEEITTDCTTETEKARAVFRWVVTNMDYKAAYGANANMTDIYDVYDRKIGSCEAYTMITNYMLYLCGIPTATVSNITHEWSAAYVDGEWIYIDTTHYLFDNTDSKANIVSFAYDGLVYVIDDPIAGGKVTGIAKTEEEIEALTTFTIPTNSYMTSIYKTSFDSDIELRAEIGTVGADFIQDNRQYLKNSGNQIIGSNTPLLMKGDMDKNGKITPYDALLINVIYEQRRTPTAEELEIGDIDGNGRLTPYDALLINVAYENRATL